MNDIELIDEIVKRAEEHQKQREKEFAIAELEKIKSKMEVIHNRYAINFQGFSMSVAQECIDIIDNEIAELKGE